MAGLRRPRLLDPGLGLLCAGLWLDRVVRDPRGLAGPRWAVAFLLLTPVGVLLRRRAPFRASLLVFAPIVVHAAASRHAPEGLVLVVPSLIMVYSLGRYADRHRGLAGLAVAAAALSVHTANDPDVHWNDPVGLWALAFWLLIQVLAGVVGAWAGAQSRERRERWAAAAAEDQARRVLAAERTRIARELHDVIAHHVNVVVLQSIAAQGLLAVAPARAGGPLAVIERSGRDALVELRRLLGFLREDGSEPGLAPQPTLDRLDDLVAGVREAGLPVELTVAGDRRALPAGVELAAYRIVQEALTNTLKHGGPAHATVRLAYTGVGLDVEVFDDGPGPTPSGPPTPAQDTGPRHGLVGMRERVALYGGSLQVGARPHGGFAVQVTLPAPALGEPR